MSGLLTTSSLSLYLVSHLRITLARSAPALRSILIIKSSHLLKIKKKRTYRGICVGWRKLKLRLVTSSSKSLKTFVTINYKVVDVRAMLDQGLTRVGRLMRRHQRLRTLLRHRYRLIIHQMLVITAAPRLMMVWPSFTQFKGKNKNTGIKSR